MSIAETITEFVTGARNEAKRAEWNRQWATVEQALGERLKAGQAIKKAAAALGKSAISLCVSIYRFFREFMRQRYTPSIPQAQLYLCSRSLP